MKTTMWMPLVTACLSGALACSGGGGGGGGGGEPPPPPDECAKAANVAKREQLLAAQPALGVRTKSVIQAATTFASVADDPAVTCSVTLAFKDLNGNGALDPYEDWTRAAGERAADLAGRMTSAEKIGLMLHPATTDVPAGTSPPVSAGLQALIGAGVRFGVSAANLASLTPRAAWANNVQALCEASSLGIPFVLSMEPAHTSANGRVKARGFSDWPQELSLAATRDLAVVERFGGVVSQEYRAIGVRMALSPSADLLTDPRRYEGQFTFGESHALVGDVVAAYVRGLQGAALGKTSVAAVVSHFPGAGPARDGWDARLQKGKHLAYPANNIDAHLAPFARAFSAGVAGVMSGYGVPETGSWTGLGGLLDGATIEQVGASFNRTLLTDVLRTHYGFSGLVIAPRGILEDAGLSPLGAPWGMETATKAERAAKAIGAGVDQLLGLGDPAAIAAARAAGTVSDAQIDAAARRALGLMFRLGLFEDPYVDAAQAPVLCNTDASYQAGLDALNRGMVLLVNADKPAGWLNGTGCPQPPCDGTQVADKGNAGNGTLKVLPAPPGEPYVAAGCRYFVAGNFDLDYVRTVSAGYGELTNDVESIAGVPVSTPAERMARSDYVFIRIDAPFSHDPDSGLLGLPLASLVYGGAENASQLDVIAEARAAIDALPTSKAQIIVGVSGGRPSVVSEVLSHGVSGLYYEWGTNLSSQVDKVFLDVAFGIVDGRGKLPVGLPLSDAAVDAQQEDLAGDGQHGTFVEGFGFQTTKF